MRPVRLALTEKQHRCVFEHLFPGDGREAAAVLICGSGSGRTTERLTATKILRVPHEKSSRAMRSLQWPFGDCFPPDQIEVLEREGQSFVTVHSHPNGFPTFSDRDDRTDRELFSSAANWFDDGRPLGSAIMLPDGRIKARTVGRSGGFQSMASVTVVGDDIQIWPDAEAGTSRASEATTEQVLGQATVRLLHGLRVGVIGCSGTGSVMVELLIRNSVGTLVLVDPDVVEERNLNRIVGATQADVADRVLKVVALERAVRRAGLGTEVETYPSDTFDEEVVRALVDCDVVFGCVDSLYGRYHLECIATAFLIPYFDLGVTIDVDGAGGVTAADAVAHYIHPEGTSLLDRGAYRMDQVKAEILLRTSPEDYRSQRRAGYLADVEEDRPAVLSVNAQAALLAFNDFLSRIHRVRHDGSRSFGEQRFRIAHGSFEPHSDDGVPNPLFARWRGSGDRSVLVQNNLTSGDDS